MKIGEDGIKGPPDGSHLVGHLVGSTITMEKSIRNLTGKSGLPEETARKLMDGNPRKAIGEPSGESKVSLPG